MTVWHLAGKDRDKVCMFDSEFREMLRDMSSAQEDRDDALARLTEAEARINRLIETVAYLEPEHPDMAEWGGEVSGLLLVGDRDTIVPAPYPKEVTDGE